MLRSGVSVLDVAQSSSEIPEGLMNNSVHSSVSCRWNVDGMYVLLCAPWCGVETPWVGQALGGWGLSRVTRSVARSVV
jgi:hypothetical protein